MLDINDAIREEYRVVNDKRGPYKQKVWIFLCTDCGKEMPKRKGNLSSHTGKCVACVKRNGRPYQAVYNGMKSSVERTNSRWKYRSEIEEPFDLTFDEFLELIEVGLCAYCGKTLQWNEWGPGPYQLDRKNSSKGYTRDNLITCCIECNRMKMAHYSFDEFVAIRKLLDIFRSGSESEKRELMYLLISWKDEYSYG